MANVTMNITNDTSINLEDWVRQNNERNALNAKQKKIIEERVAKRLKDNTVQTDNS